MDVVIGLGGNLGDRRATLASAVAELRSLVSVRSVSALYESVAVGPPQPDYLNAALRGLFSGEATALLRSLLGIERKHGRARRERWGPRTLDLDVLWISGVEVALPDLVVPHPRLAERRFALSPLLDVAPDALHPRTGEPLENWLAALPTGGLTRLEGPDWAR